MAVLGDEREALRDDARRVREGVRRDNIEEKLENVVEEKPGVRPFLDMRPLLLAVAIAAVLTLIVSLLLSPVLGAVVLLLSFGISWVVLSKRRYEERRPTSDARDADDGKAHDEGETLASGKKKSEVMPYSS